jgi:hypothetical protein
MVSSQEVDEDEKNEDGNSNNNNNRKKGDSQEDGGLETKSSDTIVIAHSGTPPVSSGAGNDIVDKKLPTSSTGSDEIDEENEDEDLVCGICLESLSSSTEKLTAGATSAVHGPDDSAVTVDFSCAVIDDDHKTTSESPAAEVGQTKKVMTADEKSVQTVRRKKFGLLTGCNHVFCVECLRQWRKEQKKAVSELSAFMAGSQTHETSSSERVRACPTCRQVSDFIVPSDRFCVGAVKAQVVAAYKARLSVLKCKRFNGKMGSCPFGRDCFYAHMRRGKDVKQNDKSKKEIWEIQQQRQNRNRQRQYNYEELNFFEFSRFASSLHEEVDVTLREGTSRSLNRGSRRPAQTVEEALQAIINEHRLSMEMFTLAMIDAQEADAAAAEASVEYLRGYDLDL